MNEEHKVTNSRNRTTWQRGFTLIEVLVVIALIGIVSAISYPSMSDFSKRYSFRAASREVLTTAMQARSNAVRDNRSWRLSVSPATNSYSLIDPDGAVAASHDLSTYGNGIKLIAAVDTSCGTAEKNWNGDAISQAGSIGPPDKRISFSGRGFSDAGSIFIEDSSNKVCFAVSASANGIVKMHRYNGVTPYSNSNWK